MKRYLYFFILLCVCLCGCAKKDEITAYGPLGTTLRNETRGIMVHDLGNLWLLSCDMTGETLELPKYFTDDRLITNVTEGGMCDLQGVTTLIVPDGYEALSMFSFSRCKDLRTVVLGKDLRIIEESVFCYCDQLEQMIVDPENPYLYAEGNCVIERETDRLIAGCVGSQIPYGVKTIGASAFARRFGRKTYEIPDTVEIIDGLAFTETSVERMILPSSVVQIGRSGFSDNKSLHTVWIPASVQIIEEKCFEHCSNITIYCEATEQPAGWDENWLADCENPTVIWGAKLEEIE